MKTFLQYLAEEKTEKIGKDIGGAIYVHKDYVDEHPKIPAEAHKRALEVLKRKHPGHEYHIVKYTHSGKDKGSFSFIHSPDFDSSHEPISGDSVKVNPSGTSKAIKQKKDPQIYHHNHQFVGKDYKGFDITKSQERSKKWGEITDRIKKEKPEERVMNKIGIKSYWEKNVTPHIK